MRAERADAAKRSRIGTRTAYPCRCPGTRSRSHRRSAARRGLALSTDRSRCSSATCARARRRARGGRPRRLVEGDVQPRSYGPSVHAPWDAGSRRSTSSTAASATRAAAGRARSMTCCSRSATHAGSSRRLVSSGIPPAGTCAPRRCSPAAAGRRRRRRFRSADVGEPGGRGVLRRRGRLARHRRWRSCRSACRRCSSTARATTVVPFEQSARYVDASRGEAELITLEGAATSSRSIRSRPSGRPCEAVSNVCCVSGSPHLSDVENLTLTQELGYYVRRRGLGSPGQKPP